MASTKPPCLAPEIWHLQSVTSLASFSLNIVLLWLIVNKTSAEVKKFSRVLLCTNLADLNYTIWAFIVDWRTSFRDGIYYNIVNGLLSRVFDLPLGMKFTLAMINGYTLFAMVALLAVPFVYRYLVVCRQVTVSNSKFAILVGIALVIPLMQPMNGYVNYWSNLLRTLEEQNDVIEASTCADPGQLPLYVAAEAKSVKAMMSKYIAQFITLSSYAVIVSCSCAIYWRTRQKNMSSQVRRSHRQLTMVFSLQALTSLVLLMIPQLRAVVLAWFAHHDSAPHYLSYSYTTGLIPLFNATYTILFVGCYRRTMFRAIGVVTTRLTRKPSYYVTSLSAF